MFKMYQAETIYAVVRYHAYSNSKSLIHLNQVAQSSDKSENPTQNPETSITTVCIHFYLTVGLLCLLDRLWIEQYLGKTDLT